MTDFTSIFHGVRHWLHAQNIDPAKVEVSFNFKDIRDKYRACDQVMMECAGPAGRATQSHAFGRAEHGNIMGMAFKLEHAGVHSPHEVAEALRRLANDVDEAGKPIPLPSLESAMTKAFNQGDVVGDFAPPIRADKLNIVTGLSDLDDQIT